MKKFSADIKDSLKRKGEQHRNPYQPSPKKRIFSLIALLVLSVGLLVAFTFWMNHAGCLSYMGEQLEEVFMEEGWESKMEHLQAAFSRILEDEIKSLQKELAVLIVRRVSAMSFWARSPQNLQNFCDEYFSYLKGFVFAFRGLQDLVFFRDKESHMLQEVQSMVQKHCLYGLEGELNQLYVDMDETVQKRILRAEKKLRILLDENFSQETLQKMKEDFAIPGVTGVLPVGQMAIRLAADLGIGRICSFYGPLGGILAGVVVDMVLAKVIRFISEDETRENLDSSLEEAFVKLEDKLLFQMEHTMNKLLKSLEKKRAGI